MAKSFRVAPELEERLEQAARAEGIPISVFIREAVARRCDEVLGRTLLTDLVDVIGVVDGPSGVAERTGEAFTELLASRAER